MAVDSTRYPLGAAWASERRLVRCAATANAVRRARWDLDRLPGDRRRSGRHACLARLYLASRFAVDGALHRQVPRPPGVVLAADHVRQAWYGLVGPHLPAAHA